VDWVRFRPAVLTSAVEFQARVIPMPRDFCRLDGHRRGQNIRYATTGQANEVGRTAIGAVAERSRPLNRRSFGNR
jgi:hypothetical protein